MNMRRTAFKLAREAHGPSYGVSSMGAAPDLGGAGLVPIGAAYSRRTALTPIRLATVAAMGLVAPSAEELASGLSPSPPSSGTDEPNGCPSCLG